MSGRNLTFNPSTANSQFFINGITGNVGLGTTLPSTKLQITSGTNGVSGLRFTNLLSTSPASISNGRALTVDANGNVILTPVVNTTTNIYNSDGIFLTNRIITMSGNNLTFIPSTANSQFFVNGTNGNVGLGTTLPSTKLQITSGTNGVSGLRFTNLTATGSGKFLSVDANGNVVLVPLLTIPNNIYTNDGALGANRIVTMSGNNLTFNPSTTNSQFFVNGTTGNVGVGTVSPTEKLEVNGNIKAQTGFFYKSLPNNQTFSSYADRNSKCEILTAGSLINQGGGIIGKTFNFFDFPTSNFNLYPEVFFTIADRNSKDRFSFNAEAGNITTFKLLDKNEQEFFKMSEDGTGKATMLLSQPNSFLGIGTNSFTDGADTYRLSVNGNIRAHRVKVYTTWADYVFEKNYILPTLQEVENHIKEKGHLKDIPSAAEVEESGIELGEMNKLLLQKVEELTLYIIQMNKELQEMKNQLKQ